MAMEGVFRKIFGRKGIDRETPPESGNGAQLHPAISAELQRLDHYRPSLGRLAIRYVATGEPAEVIDTITSLCKATPRHSAPFFKDHAAFAEAEGKTNVALVTAGFEPGPELRRLLRIRVATGAINRPYNATPGEQELVLAGFSAMIFGGLS